MPCQLYECLLDKALLKTLPQKKIVMLGGDVCLIIASFYLTPVLRFGVYPALALLLDWPDISAILTYLLFFYIFDFYNLDDQFSSAGYFFRFCLALIVADFFIVSLFYIFNVRPYATVIFFLNSVSILLLCLSWRFVFYRWNRRKKQVLRVLIIGAGWAGTDMYKLLSGRSDFEVVGFLDDDPKKLGMRQIILAPEVIGGTDLLSEVIRKKRINLVIIAITHGINQDLYKRIVDTKLDGVSVYDMPTFCELVLGKIPVHHISNLWFLYMPISGVRKTIYNLKVKRIIDILLSLVILVVLSPLMAIAAIAIKLDSPGPVFYVQKRIGWRGDTFNLLKFRSMQVGLENHRKLAGQKDDPRITKVGKILRVSRFDEVPQMWNVIRGEMSFIGPRSLIEEEVTEFKAQIPYFSMRQYIRPGITGWAQINYPHGVTVEDGLAKLEYDLYYLKNMSPMLDLIILVKTVRTVLFGRGAK